MGESTRFYKNSRLFWGNWLVFYATHIKKAAFIWERCLKIGYEGLIEMTIKPKYKIYL